MSPNSQPPMVVLASKSTARLNLLRRVGIQAIAIDAGLNETQFVATSAAQLATTLAEAKGLAATRKVSGDVILIAADSVLEFEGRSHGKPEDQAAVIEQWSRMRGNSGMVHTGHFVGLRTAGKLQTAVRGASTEVWFADLSDAEILAYAQTDEPLRAAGAFDIFGLAAAFVTSVNGDPNNVAGLSLPLVRQMLLDLGVEWQKLWRPELTSDRRT